MSRRLGGLTAAALLSLQLAGCGGGPRANCGVDGVRPHPEIGGEILYTCYAQPGGHGALFLLDVATGRVRALTTDRARNVGATWSPDGHRIVYESTRDGRSDLYVMDLPNGAIWRLTDGRGFNEEPSWSPDGARIAFASSRDGITAPLGSARFHLDLYRMRSDGTGVWRLTSLPGATYSPTWSPAGVRIAFVSDRDGNFDIFTMADDGRDQRQITDFHRMAGFSAYPRWSPDGSHIVFNASNPPPGPAASIYSVRADGSEVHRLTDGYDFKPDWSPDSRWIVFLRKWQGHTELFIARSDGGGVTQVTGDGADKDGPRWRP